MTKIYSYGKTNLPTALHPFHSYYPAKLIRFILSFLKKQHAYFTSSRASIPSLFIRFAKLWSPLDWTK